MAIIYLSLIINILVAGFWGIVLSFNIKSAPADRAFGQNTTARTILGNIYLAIALASVIAVTFQSLFFSIIITLFPLQIFYKLLTLLTAKHKLNPVIISNVCIAILHSFSLYLLITQ